MTQYLSDKLRVLSLLSIILVLYIHSGFHAYEITGMVLNDKVQEFISGMVGRCAVPLFYIVSGYLFFLNVPDGMKSIYGKMKKRMRTLFVPYIVGCLFFVIFGVLVAIIPGTSKYMNGSVLPMFQKPIAEILYSIFYDAGNGTPCAFQLWFLRDLILIVATSPIWYLCLRHFKWLFVIVTFGLAYFRIPQIPFYALFWFVLGGNMVQAKFYWGGRKLTFTLCVSVLFLLLSVTQLFLPEVTLWKYIKIPVIILGIVGIWSVYDVIVGAGFELIKHPWLATACQFTFFIYVFHEPTLNIVRKLIVALLGKEELGYLTSYIVSPWLFVFCAILVGLVFRKWFPKIYMICTGGR